MKKPKVSLALDNKGGLLIESAGASARLFVHETDGGGLYFEVAMERGSRIHPNTGDRSQLCTISAERSE